MARSGAAILILLSALLAAGPAGAQSSTWVRPPTEADVSHAADWVKFSAANGEPWAQYMLGTMYEFGKGMPASDADAFAWYVKAAEGGDANGQFRCGLMYHEGRGTDRDDARAFTWLTQAMQNGSADAANLLGVLYAFGNGAVAVDEAKAVELWRKAAREGVPDAQFNLAAALAHGRGTETDPDAAARWYVKAAYTYLAADRRPEAWRAVTALSEVNPTDAALPALQSALAPAQAPPTGAPPPAQVPLPKAPDAPELAPAP